MGNEQAVWLKWVTEAVILQAAKAILHPTVPEVYREDAFRQIKETFTIFGEPLQYYINNRTYSPFGEVEEWVEYSTDAIVESAKTAAAALHLYFDGYPKSPETDKLHVLVNALRDTALMLITLNSADSSSVKAVIENMRCDIFNAKLFAILSKNCPEGLVALCHSLIRTPIARTTRDYNMVKARCHWLTHEDLQDIQNLLVEWSTIDLRLFTLEKINKHGTNN